MSEDAKIRLGRFFGPFAVAAAFFISYGVLAVFVSASSSAAVPISRSNGVISPLGNASSTATAFLIPYVGKIYHVFFHSLVIYPELAFKNDGRGKLYEDYMITRTEFEKILQGLYQNQFVLIDAASMYGVDANDAVLPRIVLVPPGKKPLIVSIDDLNYYSTMKGRGFADKLVFDDEGRVATEVVTPEGQVTITRDGDVVPMLDDFIRLHPDFSVGGAKGVIAVTGREGVFGYRTQAKTGPNFAADTESAKRIAAALRAEGWRFASHSYSHEGAFSTGVISLDALKADVLRWKTEVEPIVGATDIFIGPFGQIFKEGDVRQNFLVSSGFHLLCGVGADGYFKAFPDRIIMDRADIDGVRLIRTPNLLKELFDPSGIPDPSRRMSFPVL